MYVKPINGRSVRCPVKGSSLPENGQEVPNNVYWRARLNDGDVELVKSQSKEKKV
ncbi:DUF2635 domain-containing protein [Providencia huaxiensis]|uniref:DUF2635 domain-containing protein n=1 Tax=Providencia huaxiensis TaxID=2027290 RepID=UPI001B362F33|nr:DUF2635 domain-containing protein [Providencia huaxiensis]MBQ0533468.1 DUF2635 domain-containing protein [Providencia huaxiensis]MBQ0587025.1 DUF2635 domain-containing protein [Providencia huaxiensis]